MKQSKTQAKISVSGLQKPQYANLVRHVPSGIFFAQFRVGGKLIRRSLKTDSITVAKLRWADLEAAGSDIETAEHRGRTE